MCVPQNACVESLPPMELYLEIGPLQKELGLNEVLRVEA